MYIFSPFLGMMMLRIKLVRGPQRASFVTAVEASTWLNLQSSAVSAASRG